ncbi:MAG: hypothetical protein AAGD11_18570 [Planctomycetota bacterium]
MLRTLILLLVMFASLLDTRTFAASITAVPFCTSAGYDGISFILDPTGSVGAFDTFELVVTSDVGPIRQVGTPGELLMQPSEDSGFSAFLTAPVSFGGQGLSSFGVDATTDTSAGISGTFASLGSNEASLLGEYLVAQVTFERDSSLTYGYAFFDDGVRVSGGAGILGLNFVSSCVPEPKTIFVLLQVVAMLLATNLFRANTDRNRNCEWHAGSLG